MEQYNLDEPFEIITGINVTGETYPDMLCVECAQRLLNCIKFRGKCIRGHILLTEIWDTYGGLTIQAVKSVDRRQNSLVSQLQVKYIEADHYDLYCDHTDTHTDGTPIDGIEEIDSDIEYLGEIDKDMAREDLVTSVIEMNEDYQFGVTEVEADTNVEEVEIEQGLSNTDIAVEDSNETIQSQGIDRSGYESDSHDPTENLGWDSDTSGVLSSKTKLIEQKAKVVLKKRPQETVREEKLIKSKDINVSNEEFYAMFTITAINVEEQRKLIEKVNEKYWKSGYIMFKCDECGRQFVDKVTYNNHIVRHNTKFGKYQCKVCKLCFKRNNNLWRHELTHKRKFQCNKCTFQTAYQRSAMMHVAFHRGVMCYKCAICDTEFKKPSTYYAHKRTKHPTDVVCEFCGYSFVSQRGLHLHKIVQHRLEMDVGQIPSDSPWCEACNIHFYSEDALKVHISLSDKHRTYDDGKRPYNELKRCRKKQTVTTVKRRKAETTKAGESIPISCEQCDEVLDSPRAYHHHFRRSHPGMTRTVYYPPNHLLCMCEICGRMCQNAGHLKDHMNAHTGEKKFKCDKCEKSFATKMHLQIHSSIHSEDRPLYECPTCGKKFTNNGNRSRHMIIHTGIKAFKCNECDKSFTHRYGMRAHIRYVHLKVPWPKRPPRQRNVPQPKED